MDSISVIFAAVLSVFGGQEPQATNYGCETVDVGGYRNFVDPTCPPHSDGPPLEVEAPAPVVVIDLPPVDDEEDDEDDQEQG